MKKEKTEVAAESEYAEVQVFQQAVCANCQKVIVVQQLRVFTDRAALEQFALGAHNALVKNAGLLCVNPQLTIFFGNALVLSANLQEQPPTPPLIG